MGPDQLKELKRLQKESEPMERQWSERHWRTRLRKAVSDLTLDALILKEAAGGVRAVQELIQWINSGLNGRSP